MNEVYLPCHSAPHSFDLLVLAHGIHRNLTRASWIHDVNDIARQRGLRIEVNMDSYKATALPHWNVYVKNPRIARGVVDQTLRTMDKLAIRNVYLWGHSNGTNILTRAAHGLARKGVPVKAMLLTGSAVHSDVEKNGLLRLHKSGMLERAVAWCSPADRVTRPLLEKIPGGYGSLGTQGWTLGKSENGDVLTWGQTLGGGPEWPFFDWERGFLTRWFPGYEHSEWFEEERMEETFDLAMGDLGWGRGAPGRSEVFEK